MAIKFGVAGTHSTGKSSLIEGLRSALEKRGITVGYVADLATNAHAKGFPILRDHTFESTLWIMTRGISEQLEAGLKTDVVLVDRPALDAVGYLYAALAHRKVQLPSEQMDYLLSLARYDAYTYEILCCTELDPTIELGPERDDDLAFRSKAGEKIAQVFSDIDRRPRNVTKEASFVEDLAQELAKAISRTQA